MTQTKQHYTPPCTKSNGPEGFTEHPDWVPVIEHAWKDFTDNWSDDNKTSMVTAFRMMLKEEYGIYASNGTVWLDSDPEKITAQNLLKLKWM